MSDLGSYKSNVNPDVYNAIIIAANSKTNEFNFNNNINKMKQENTKECIKNILRAIETSYEEVARKITRDLENKRIMDRQNIDWGYTCYQDTSKEYEIGD